MTYAQNLGQQPATGQAVQGQTAAQPEGTVLNLVNWVGNVIAPVGAALAVFMAVVAPSPGPGGVAPAVTPARLLVVFAPAPFLPLPSLHTASPNHYVPLFTVAPP